MQTYCRKLNIRHNMLPHTFLEPQDDPAFLAIVDRIVSNLCAQHQTEEAHLIHIDNWFDHKWLRYSGYGIVPFPEGHHWIESVKKERWQDQVTFPPFTPKRVVAQFLFGRIAEHQYEEQAPPYLIHSRQRKSSTRNLNRRVTDFCQSGLFVWYSSGTTSNLRGSIMVYRILNGEVATWYASFSQRGGWQLDQVKGIDRDTVLTLTTSALPNFQPTLRND